MDLDPRRIENVRVILPPQRLDCVAVGGFGAQKSGAKVNVFPVPVRAAIRRQDRPAHVGKAIDEKGRVPFYNMMPGFEPGDIPRPSVVVSHGAKTDKGTHFMHVVPDGLVHLRESMDVGVDGNLEQMGLAVGQPKQCAVEQGPALRIAVACDTPGDLQELAWYPVVRWYGSRVFVSLFKYPECWLQVVEFLPMDHARFDAVA